MNRNFKKILLFTLSVVFIFFIVYQFIFLNFETGENRVSDTTHKIENKVRSVPLTVMIFANGGATELKSKIVYKLGDYNLHQSDAPGYMMQVNCEEADYLNVNVTNGSLLKWNNENGIVYKLGEKSLIKSGDRVYWSPLNEGEQNLVLESVLHFNAYKNEEKIASERVEISSENGVFYCILK